MKKHTYSKDEINYIRKIAPYNTCDQIVEKFNKKYKLNQSKKSLKGVRYRNGIKVGVINNPTQFKKGHTPWSKGKKGINLGGEEGWFKKGPSSPKWLPVGTERIDKQGYTLVKIEEPDIWKRKHYLIYEKENGEIPGGNLVIFADGNKNNFDSENLILISRGQLRRLDHSDLRFKNSELTKVGLNIVKVQEAIVNRNDDI